MAEALKKVFADKHEQVSSSPQFQFSWAKSVRDTRTKRDFDSSLNVRNLADKPDSAFVTFITAGYPTRDATVPLMLALEGGGADIIELGVPFSDPIADGPVIQAANTVRTLIALSSEYLGQYLWVIQIAIENNVHFSDCLRYVREARAKGLKAPVILMGNFI